MNEIEGTQRPKLVTPSAHAVGCPPVMSWFVMRATYSRELKARSLMNEAGVECYVPMRRIREENGDRIEPAVHNLVFAHTTRDFMDAWKRRVEPVCPLRYVMDHTTGNPMVVPEKEMDDFIRVTSSENDQLLFLDNPNAVVEKGKDVEIIAGPYKGVKGKILRILRNRRVVVSITDVMAVAINGIPFAWMKEIKKEDDER